MPHVVCRGLNSNNRCVTFLSKPYERRRGSGGLPNLRRVDGLSPFCRLSEAAVLLLQLWLKRELKKAVRGEKPAVVWEVRVPRSHGQPKRISMLADQIEGARAMVK